VYKYRFNRAINSETPQINITNNVIITKKNNKRELYFFICSGKRYTLSNLEVKVVGIRTIPLCHLRDRRSTSSSLDSPSSMERKAVDDIALWLDVSLVPFIDFLYKRLCGYLTSTGVGLPLPYTYSYITAHWEELRVHHSCAGPKPASFPLSIAWISWSDDPYLKASLVTRVIGKSYDYEFEFSKTFHASSVI